MSSDELDFYPLNQFVISHNGKIIFWRSVANLPKEHFDVKVYASNPLDDAAPALIRNFQFETFDQEIIMPPVPYGYGGNPPNIYDDPTWYNLAPSGYLPDVARMGPGAVNEEWYFTTINAGRPYGTNNRFMTALYPSVYRHANIQGSGPTPYYLWAQRTCQDLGMTLLVPKNDQQYEDLKGIDYQLTN